MKVSRETSEPMKNGSAKAMLVLARRAVVAARQMRWLRM
jgi:hypothetical protein